MPRTIVQEYGPIYGEPVNGTVMGRPNGSVYVPLLNTIGLEVLDEYKYFTYVTYGGNPMLLSCDSAGVQHWTSDAYHLFASAQDLSSHMQQQVYSDAELTTPVAIMDLSAGAFNLWGNGVRPAVAGLSDGDKVYFRAQLMNSGVAVATSDTIEMTMVIP